MASRGRPLLPLLAGLVAILALAGAAWLFLDEGDADDGTLAPVTLRPSEAAPEQTTPPSLPSYDPKPRPEPEPAEVAPTATLVGRLVDSGHRPVPNGRVAVLAGERSLLLPGSPQLVTLDVDPVDVAADGSFRVTGLPPRDDVAVRAEGALFVRTAAGPFSLRAGEVTDIGNVVVDRGYTIQGIVFSHSGHEMPGARVELRYGTTADVSGDRLAPARTAITDDDGRFLIDNAPRQMFVLTASADGHAARTVAGGREMQSESSELSFSIRLGQPLEVHGRVVKEQGGQGVAGVQLIARGDAPEGGSGSARSGGDGSFTLRGLVEGGYSVTVNAEGYARRVVRLDRDKLDAELLITLKEDGGMRGKVTDQLGEPVSHFDLRVRFGHRKNGIGPAAGAVKRIRDPGGRFELEGLEPGWYQLELWSKGHALTTTEPLRVRAGKTLGGVEIAMRRGSTLRGLVVTDLGDPLGGAKVTLRMNKLANNEFGRALAPKAAWHASTHTDEEGVYQMIDIVPKVYQLEVTHPDHPTVIVNNVRAEEGREVEVEPIVVPRPARLYGVALDPAGQVVRRGTVSLGGTEGRRVRTDAEGRYAFERLAPGEYVLECVSDDRPIKMLDFGNMVRRTFDAERIVLAAGEERNENVIAIQ